MLDLAKKYFVAAGARPKSVIENWANWNEMKLVGEDLALPDFPRVYELDVRFSPDLKFEMALLGPGKRTKLKNGERVIGHVRFCRSDRGRQIVIIYPEIQDR